MPAIPACLIGIDIGTTAVKAALTGLAGQRLAGYAAPYPTARPAPGHVEQDPADWMAHVMAALAQFAQHPAAGRVAAIGITSQVNTHVFCDSALAPLAPALVWQDGRAAGAGAALDARISPAAKTAALGAPIPIDASHALARMAWMAQTHPVLWAATAHVLLPKDYAIAQLTGVVAGDPLSAVGLTGPDHRYAPAILALLDGAADRLPALHDPLAVVGQMRAGPFAGVAVVAGTMDAWAAMFGVGVAQDGQAMALSGTSEVMGLIAAHHTPTAGVITFAPWRGITLHAAPTQSGGAALDWLGTLLGQSPATLAASVAAARIRPDTPLFLPHLEGERAPLWDSSARGVFAGLAGATGPADMVLAVMEGVAFSSRLALEALEQAAGRHPGELRAGGGGTRADIWCQIRADALGRDLLRMQAPDAGAIGALVMAGAGAGLMPDLASAARALVLPDRRFTPRPAAARLAARRYALWKDLYAGVTPVNAGLKALRDRSG